MKDPLTLIWIAVAVAAGAIEVLTLDLFFLMIAGGALVAAIVAAITGNFAISVLAFAIATLALVFLARPPLKAYLQNSVTDTLTNVDALPGRTAEVLAVVDTGNSGRIRLSGEVWSARTTEPPIAVGSTVYVHFIDGATAVVGLEPAPPS